MPNHLLELTLKLCKLKDEIHQESLVIGFQNNFLELFVAAIVVKHQPSNGHVGVTQALLEGFHVVEDVSLTKLAINKIAFEAIKAILNHESIFVCHIFDVTKVNVILDGFLGCWKVIPILDNVNQITLINLNDKVVWKVLIGYLSHLGLLVFQDSWSEAEKHKYHLSLVG